MTETAFYPARDIVRAMGGSKRTVLRTAIRERWPARINGNRMEFVPPPHIADAIIGTPCAPFKFTADVKFSDLSHSDSEREKVLLREKAVQMLQANLHLGREVALQCTVASFKAQYPALKLNATTTLRNWERRYLASGLDGLVEQKRGRVGRKSYAGQLPEENLMQAAAAATERGIKGRLNIARGYRDSLIANPTVNCPVREWLHGAFASKSYVPPSVRDAIRERVSPLAAKLIQVGPKAAKLDGPYTECSYDNVPAGRAWTADDMTANCYVWVEWPNEQGYLVGRPQILAAMDIGSMAWLNIRAVMRSKGQYSSDDVWGLIGDVLDEVGLHTNEDGKVDTIAVLEGGIWQSNVVIGHKTGIDDSTRVGGLKSLGVQVIHTRTPRGKIIETAFNQLQHAADAVPGYSGRMEMKDGPEATKQALALCKAGKAHPRSFFLHLSQYREHLAGVMKALNNERNDGKILRGMTPVEKWEQDQPKFITFPDNAKWMYRAAYRVVEVTRNGVRITVGTGKFQMAYTYSNPAALEIHRGRRVMAFWNDADPDTDAVVYTIRNGKPHELICVASRVPELPRFGTSGEAMAAEAARKKMAHNLAHTQRASLAPYLQRTARTVTPTERTDAVASQIGQARADQSRRVIARRNVAKFEGSLEELAETLSANRMNLDLNDDKTVGTSLSERPESPEIGRPAESEPEASSSRVHEIAESDLDVEALLG